jgi:hypothetical protein
MKYLNAIAICLGIAFVVGCAPSQSAIQTAIAQTQIAQPTNTMLPIFTLTPTSTITATPTQTSTPSPTSPPSPTSTPIVGIYSNPAPIGVTVTQKTEEGVKPGLAFSMSASVIDVKRGDEADQLARTNLGWPTYTQPIEGQEYIAVKIQLDQLDGDPNETYSIYPYWNLTLRFEEDGEDTWSENGYDTFSKDSYPPLSWSGWVFWLIKKGSTPLLYFQPDLIISEQFGYRTSGAYLLLEKP